MYDPPIRMYSLSLSDLRALLEIIANEYGLRVTQFCRDGCSVGTGYEVCTEISMLRGAEADAVRSCTVIYPNSARVSEW